MTSLMMVVPVPWMVNVWPALFGKVMVEGLAAEPSVSVPSFAAKLFVRKRPLASMLIGPLSVRLLVSPVSLATVRPKTIDIGLAIVRLPPIGMRMLLTVLLGVSVPRPNGELLLNLTVDKPFKNVAPV